MSEFETKERPDLRWLYQRNPQFKKWCDDVRLVKEDEARYKSNPGYVPKLEAKE